MARERADVIPLKRDLDAPPRAVQEGRRVFDNTLEYACITAMALAAPLLPFLPLAAEQVLLDNILSGLPAIGISTGNIEFERAARLRPVQALDYRTRFEAACLLL